VIDFRPAHGTFYNFGIKEHFAWLSESSRIGFSLLDFDMIILFDLCDIACFRRVCFILSQGFAKLYFTLQKCREPIGSGKFLVDCTHHDQKAKDPAESLKANF
jgi:hypothetical protein